MALIACCSSSPSHNLSCPHCLRLSAHLDVDPASDLTVHSSPLVSHVSFNATYGAHVWTRNTHHLSVAITNVTLLFQVLLTLTSQHVSGNIFTVCESVKRRVFYINHIFQSTEYIYICVIFPHPPRGQCKSFVSATTQAATSGNVLKYSIQAEWCCRVSIMYQTVLNTLSVEISGRESACMTLFIFWFSSHRILTSSLITDIY